jgi:hypothetical protein
MSRNAASILFASTLALTSGLATAPPAGAAGGTSCTIVSGVARFKPGLPMRGDKTKVKPTITIKGGHIGDCSGGGVKSGLFDASLKAKVAGNCNTFSKHADMKIAGTVKITWNTKATSSVAVTLTPVRFPGFIRMQLTGDVTTHKFHGSTLDSMLNFNGGGCAKHAMTSVKFFRTHPLKIG